MLRDRGQMMYARLFTQVLSLWDIFAPCIAVNELCLLLSFTGVRFQHLPAVQQGISHHGRKALPAAGTAGHHFQGRRYQATYPVTTTDCRSSADACGLFRPDMGQARPHAAKELHHG